MLGELDELPASDLTFGSKSVEALSRSFLKMSSTSSTKFLTLG